MKQIKLYLTSFLSVLVLFSACGGGNSDSPTNPIETPVPTNTQNWQEVYENTFAKNVSVDPTTIDFGQPNQGQLVRKNFVLTNNSGEAQTFRLLMQGAPFGFRFFYQDTTDSVPTYRTVIEGITLANGAQKEFEVHFDAQRFGSPTTVPYVLIQAVNLAGHIRLPVWGEVKGNGTLTLISADRLCSGEGLASLEQLDFRRVAAGSEKKLKFKICANQSLRIDSAQIVAGNTASNSSVLTEEAGVVFGPFSWSPLGRLNPLFLNYFNPTVSSSFVEPALVANPGQSEDHATVFSMRESSANGGIAGLSIDSGGYLMVEVTYRPDLTDIQSGSGQLYEGYEHKAQIVLSTSEGQKVIALNGVTGGKEPILAAEYSLFGGEETKPINIDNPNAAINFDAVEYYEEWIGEGQKRVNLVLKNVGHGSKKLKVWLDEIDSGYYTIAPDSSLSWPIEIEAGGSKTIGLIYNPQNESGYSLTGISPDTGQIYIRHNGGNGPYRRLTLYGRKKAGDVIAIKNGSVNLSKTYSREEGRVRRYCLSRNPDGTYDPITFTVENHSQIPGNKLTVRMNESIAGSYLAPYVDFSVDNKIDVEPGQSGEFQITANFTDAGRTVIQGAARQDLVLEGNLRIDSEFSKERTYRASLDQDYSVDFAIRFASEGETCSSGAGSPLDGQITLVIDRIGMVFPSGSLPEPARNQPAAKIHIPLLVSSEDNFVLLLGAPMDIGGPYYKQLFAPAHQLTGVNLSCRPGPTTPYQVDYKPGSWTGPYQCPYDDELGDIIVPGDGDLACLPSNGFEPYSADPTKQVLYHEFIKFGNEDSCSSKFRGRIAMVGFNEGQTPQNTFVDMETDVGASGSRAQYEAYLGKYRYDSYIIFDEETQCGSRTYNAGTVIRATDDGGEGYRAIKECWEAWATDPQMRRDRGFVEECVQFSFDVQPGCIPPDAPFADDPQYEEYKCLNDRGEPDGTVTMDDPDSWKGFGFYEPYASPANPTEVDGSMWDLTVRNVEIPLFIPLSNGFFDNNAGSLYAVLRLSLSTKALGGDIGNPNWSELISPFHRGDFTTSDVFIPLSSSLARNYWLTDGLMSEFVVGSDDVDDCDPEFPMRPCKGGHVVTSDGAHLVLAGEPARWNDGNRIIVAGATSFAGRGELAPFFARAVGGKGALLYFAAKGCLKEGHDLDESVGCYEPYEDSTYLSQYTGNGILPPGSSAPEINYLIYDQDRDRLTNFYDAPDNFFVNENYYAVPGGCLFGM